MMGISAWELLVVGLILFLVVGPAKLPGLAKRLGEGIRDFRRSLNDLKGNVSPDDEFVKAVREARQSVAEAKEAVRAIFDDDALPVGQPDDLQPAGAGTRPRKHAPLGSRALVRAAPPRDGVATAGTDLDASPFLDAEGEHDESLTSEPVEHEVTGAASETRSDSPATQAPRAQRDTEPRTGAALHASKGDNPPAPGTRKRRLVRPAPRTHSRDPHRGA